MTWWNANSELEANIAELQGDLEDSKDALRKNDYTIKALKDPLRVEMFSHLKVGVKDTGAETIRVHFDWDANRKKIVIGYCGEHRNISSR